MSGSGKSEQKHACATQVSSIKCENQEVFWTFHVVFTQIIGKDMYKKVCNVNFRKTIWDLEFSEHFLYNFLFAYLSWDFRTPKKWYNCPFLTHSPLNRP